MTNRDDIFGELEFTKERIARGDLDGAIEAIDQAIKLWAAERDYWALIEADNAKTEYVNQPPARPWGSWGRQAGSLDDGDWRTTGIA